VINREVVEMLTELAKERRLEKTFVIETLKEAFISTAKKMFGKEEGFQCEVSEASGEIRLYMEKKAVKKVKNPLDEISMEDAIEINPGVKIGDTVYVEIPITQEFGRNAITQIRNFLVQKMKEREKRIVFEKYKGKIGELVAGTVASAYAAGAYVKLSDIEAFLDREEQIPGEILRRGQQLKAVVLDIEEKTRDKEKVKIKGPVVYLTRKTPNFVLRLLEFEIPEILRGEVEIKGIARSPGIRTKIAVYSKEEKVDPVGACVGPRGSRIQGIVREMSGEKIDIIPFSPDKKIFVGRSVAPARVVKVIMKKTGKKAICVVPDDQVTLGIGKDSVNIKLANELTGLKIEIIGQTEFHKKEEDKKRKKIKVDALPDISEKIKSLLKKHGYKTARDIMSSSKEELEKLPGLGSKTVDKIYVSLHRVLNLGE